MYTLDFIIDFEDEAHARQLAENLADCVGQQGIKRVRICTFPDGVNGVIRDIEDDASKRFGLSVRTDTNVPEGKAYILPKPHPYFPALDERP